MTSLWQRYSDPLEKMSEEIVPKACQLFLPGKQPDHCVLDAELSTLLNSKSVADAMSIANIGPFAHGTKHNSPLTCQL